MTFLGDNGCLYFHIFIFLQGEIIDLARTASFMMCRLIVTPLCWMNTETKIFIQWEFKLFLDKMKLDVFSILLILLTGTFYFIDGRGSRNNRGRHKFPMVRKMLRGSSDINKSFRYKEQNNQSIFKCQLLFYEANLETHFLVLETKSQITQ